MSGYTRLELRRLSDDLVYTFTRAARDDGTCGYRRDDREIWMVFRALRGWLVLDADSDEVTGIPWEVPPEEQLATRPPACDWVSKKGAKSYVYRLRYLA
jgi:hypothetical protein